MDRNTETFPLIQAWNSNDLPYWSKVLTELGHGVIILDENQIIVIDNEFVEKILGNVIGEKFDTIFVAKHLDKNPDLETKSSDQIFGTYELVKDPGTQFKLKSFPFLLDRKLVRLVIISPITKDEETFQLDHWENQLQILYEISRATQLSPKLSVVLQSALDAIIHTFQFKMGAIYTIKKGKTEETWDFVLSAYKGFEKELYNHVKRFSVEPSQLASIKRTFAPKWLNRKDIFFPLLRQRMREHSIDEILCVPLFSKKTLLGLLYLTNNDPMRLGPEHLPFLISLGRQLGVAIDNAQLLESISRAKTELEISFDAIQHNIFVIDYNYSIYRVNRATRKKYGRLEDILGKKYYQVIYQEEDPPPNCPIFLCFLTAKPVQEEGEHPRWGGYYQFHAFPVFSTSGELERVVYYEKDITEERKMEERFRQSERLKSLGTLATGIAHEIRNPLASIHLNIQMLARELELNDDQAQMMADIQSEIKKIDRIVKQVLGFARPSKPAVTENSLNEIVSYCHKLTRTQLRKKGIKVTVELDQTIPPIFCDFDQVAQVVMNLIINALEAMPNGGKLELKTFIEEEKNRIGLMIKDNGTGISPEDQNRIFDPFFTRKVHGSGLGLYISQQILEKHQATIDFTSRPGKGTCFYVYFPVSGNNGMNTANGR